MQPGMFQVGDFSGVLKRRPAILRIPKDIRRKNRQGQQRRQPQARIEKLPAPRRNQQQRQQGRRRKQHHRVLAQQPQTASQAEHQPMFPGIALQRQHQGQHRPRPKQQQQHIGGNNQIGQSHAGHQQERGRRPHADARIKQYLPQAKHQPGGERIHQQRPRFDAKHTIATDARGQGNQGGNHRRLGVIAPIKLLRPAPVIGLIDIQADVGGSQHSGAIQRDACDQGKQGEVGALWGNSFFGIHES